MKRTFVLCLLALLCLQTAQAKPSRRNSSLDDPAEPHLSIVRDGDSIRLFWTPDPEAPYRAVLRDGTGNFADAETLAVTSATTWLDDKVLLDHDVMFYALAYYPVQSPDTAAGIEDFDAGAITLESLDGQDDDPNDWELTSNSYEGASALRLFGDTWKSETIAPAPLAFNTLWRIAVRCDRRGEVQAFGIGDGENWIRYLLWGSECPQGEIWIAVYQGWFAEDEWVLVDLPVGEDWFGRFGYLPAITQLHYINDNDSQNPEGEILFDEIHDVTEALPIAPVANFQWSLASAPSPDSIRVNFFSLSYDPDSPTIEHLWNFGDGTLSSAENVSHLYPRHGIYTVTLTVTDADNNVAWQSLAVEDPPVTMSRELRAAFTGDIMLARGYESSIIPNQGVEAIFEPTLLWLLDVDFTSVNLESPLTTSSDRHPTKQITFKGDPDNVAGLVYAGIDYATLANNHIIDYMEAGMLETMSVLENEGIAHSGAGMNDLLARRPAFVSRNGLSLAMLGFSNRTGSYLNDQPYLDAGRSRMGHAMWNLSNILATVPAAAELSDFVIVNVHSGDEYVDQPYRDTGGLEPWDPEIIIFSEVPDADERLLRQQALDNGAALVINHHPHVIQGFEVYDGKLIAHSMGNYTFDLSYPECKPTIVLHTHFAAEIGVDEAVVHPAYIDHWIPRPAVGGLARALLDYETHLSRGFDTWLVRQPGEDSARIIFDTTLVTRAGIDYIDTLALTEDNGWWTSPIRKLAGDGYPVSVSVEDLIGCEIRLGRDLLWYGNMEDEGATEWSLNSGYEGYNTDEFHAGARSIRLRREENTPGNVITNLPMRLPMKSEYAHSACGWVKTLNAIEAVIQVDFSSSRSGGYLNGLLNAGAPLSGDNDWTWCESELEVPANAAFFNIRMNLNETPSGTALAWFDDLAVIQWDDWQPAPADVYFPNAFTFLQIRSPSSSPDAVIHYRREWIP